VRKFPERDTRRPTKLSRWRGKGHINATIEYNELDYGANQYLGAVDVFKPTQETA
jgi:hypothetical protein